jgi:Tfp pilus assembly protein PilX
MKTPASRNPRAQGSILIVALIAMGVLALIATGALYSIGNRHAVSFHSQSWNDALASAEVGTDVALAAMNESIANPTTAWLAWSPSDATTFPKTWTPPITPHSGEGNVQVHAQVTIDDAIADSNGERWFRVRSMGVAEVVGTQRRGIEPAVLDSSGQKNHRSMLRKTRFSNDLTGGALRLPQVARSIECLAGSVRARRFTRGLAVQNAITMSGGAIIDSFDSTDPAKSTGGRYDPAKRQDRADIATNSSGDLSDLNGCEVRGSAYSNGGAIQDPGGVVGAVFDNFSTNIPEVTTPVWGTINVTPSAISNPTGGLTLAGGPAGTPQNYKVTTLALTTAANSLTLAPHVVGQQSFVNIWITGGLSVTGTAFIQLEPGVHATFYVEDNIAVGGGGIVNGTGLARNLQVFGVNPASGTRTISITGSADFIGVINAPAHDLSLSGTGGYSGAAIARSATIISTSGYHYDESLADLSVGPPERYEYASWIEDVR